MIRSILVLMVIGMMFALGCSSAVTPDTNKDLESFFSGVSPEPTGVIGSYTFTGNDGTLETGQIVKNSDGVVTAVAERGSSVLSNFWFKIDVDYLSPRGYTGMGLPYYYLGDTFTYKINVDYKRGLPLNWYPLLYGKMTAAQAYYPSLALLPGASLETWDPFQLAPFENKVVSDDFTIVPGTIPGNDCTIVTIYMKFMCGMCEIKMVGGVAGLWDP